ncbi:MAG: sialate O-acetylesterase [Lentisphaeria bacterium]|nr:sialate O-acetylesterase [Lentisphaeria bacterium]
MIKSLAFVPILALMTLGIGAQAAVTLPEIFQDHMILQQGVPLKIWGTAGQGGKVTVRFAGQEKSATADADGNWQVELDPLEASSEPRTLTVAPSTIPPSRDLRRDTPLIIADVLVGEVWLASGQSNMVSGVKQVPGDQRRIFTEQKDNKRVRGFVNGKWYLLSEQALHTSAVGFFFALKLEQTLDVPVGYVVIAQLGSKIEPFVPPAEAEAARLGNKASDIFTKRIAPVADYAIKGVIWYQGESNRGADNYFECLKALHNGWSRAFNMPGLPFYQVQIAPYSKAETRTSLISDSVWAAQYRAAREIPGMGIVPLHDAGIHVKQIHPRSKQPVGERLAALALKNQYGENVVTTGPVFSKAVRDGTAARVSFYFVDQGLTTKDGQPPSFFELSADGKTFVAAEARIADDQVVVTAGRVATPKFVRMGWFDTAIPNLRDKNGWPAYAFPSQAVE